jgi:hypothetical protein
MVHKPYRDFLAIWEHCIFPLLFAKIRRLQQKTAENDFSLRRNFCGVANFLISHSRNSGNVGCPFVFMPEHITPCRAVIVNRKIRRNRAC